MAVMVVLSTLANGVNYASSLVFSRVLEPVGFGELTSLLALSLVLAVPLGAAQTIVAERVAVARAAGDDTRVGWLIRHALGHVAMLGAIVGVLYVVSIPLVVSVLDIRQPGPVIALAPLVVLSFINPVTFGVLQGLERFVALGVVMFAVAGSRLLFGVPWALAGGGPGGAIAGQALGLLTVHLLTLWSLHRLLIARGTGAASSGLRRRLDVTALSASGAFVSFAILANLDLLLARLYLDGESAGIYAAIATVAKVVIFLPSAVALIMVPIAARAHARQGDSSRILKTSAGIVALAATACAVPAALAPELVVDVMFGAGYDAAKPGVLPAVLAGAGLAMLNLICIYTVAIRDRRWLWLLVGGVALQVAGIASFHDSPQQIAWVQVGVAGAVLLSNELLFHSLVPRWRRSRS
jgi:O-antigen/teichoic acid export membrane protein